jgi:hypothetical protein
MKTKRKRVRSLIPSLKRSPSFSLKRYKRTYPSNRWGRLWRISAAASASLSHLSI